MIVYISFLVRRGIRKMTNEEFLQRYDSSEPDFTEDEIRKMVFRGLGNRVDEIGGECDRWTQAVQTIFEVDGRLFAVSWYRGLTENQENDFYDAEVYEVERKEKVIFDYVRKDTHD